MKYKVCSRCKIKKPVTEFHKCYDWVQSRCKICRNIKTLEERKREVKRVKKWRENLTKEKRIKMLKRLTIWRKKYRANMTEREKENKRKKSRIKYMSQEAIDRRRKDDLEYVNRRYANNINFRIKKVLSSRIYKVLKNNKKSSRTIALLGCSIIFLKKYLKKKFKSGMSWDNYGKWHIDHIKPCASFDLSKPKQQKECFFYKNLQPLWAKDNMLKSSFNA